MAQDMGCASSAPLTDEELAPHRTGPDEELATRPWRTLNVVCLHGNTMNADLMRGWEAMRSLEKRCDGIATFHYVSAPHKFEANDWSRTNSIPVHDGSRAWFTTPPEYGWGASQACVAEFAASQVRGPIDVLIGYSQGGLMVANLLQYLSETEPYRSVRGAVLIHAPDFINNAPNHKLCPSLKTVHVIGAQDKLVQPSSSAQLAQRFIQTETATHDGEHYIFTPFPAEVLDRIYRMLVSLKLL